jgi:hypothetical protein
MVVLCCVPCQMLSYFFSLSAYLRHSPERLPRARNTTHVQGAWTDYTGSSYVINFERDIKILKMLSIHFLLSVNWLKTATIPIAVTQLAKFKCSTIS